jgi:hypothetical protein
MGGQTVAKKTSKVPKEALQAYDEVTFRVSEGPLPGEVEEHAGVVSGYIDRTIEQLQEDWRKISTQVQGMLEPLAYAQGNFRVDEVEFSLGLSAEAGLHFVAKGGVDTGIKVTWKRKP